MPKVSPIRHFALAVLLFAILIISGCSKDEITKKEDLPEYSIKINRDGKLIYKGNQTYSDYGWYTSMSKTFFSHHLIVIPKYPDNPDSKTVETVLQLEDGTSFLASIQVAGGVYEGITEDREKIKEKTYPVYPYSDNTELDGIKFLYQGKTDNETWTHINGEHTITKMFIVKQTIKDSNGEKFVLPLDYINGEFAITYKDKSGQHTITGQYRNLSI